MIDRRAQDLGRAVTAGLCTRTTTRCLGTVRLFLGAQKARCEFGEGVCGKTIQERFKAAAQMSYNYQRTSAIQ